MKSKPQLDLFPREQSNHSTIPSSGTPISLYSIRMELLNMHWLIWCSDHEKRSWNIYTNPWQSFEFTRVWMSQRCPARTNQAAGTQALFTEKPKLEPPQSPQKHARGASIHRESSETTKAQSLGSAISFAICYYGLDVFKLEIKANELWEWKKRIHCRCSNLW